jgi:hypothetical protein
MKKLITLFLAILSTYFLFAQAPQRMSYQALIRNSSNALVTNQAVGMRISILQGAATGSSVYSEVHTPTTNANGLVTIEIGGGSNPSCLDLVSGGQTDWYLPSIDELNLLWDNRFIVNKALSTINGATDLPLSANYWSSTETGSNSAFFLALSVGYVNARVKDSSSYVRAVRAF